MQLLQTLRRGTTTTVALFGLVLGACDSPAGPPAVASIQITPSAPQVLVGATEQLTATVKKADGTAISGVTVTWQSQNEPVATVNSTGRVAGIAGGTARITASAGGKTAEVTVTVREPSPVSLTDISPATLQPGVTATITGTGFSPNAGENSVTIAGFPAAVTAATATTLTVTVPAAACAATGEVLVSVLVAGFSGERVHPWQSSAPLQLAVGEQLRMDPAGTYCLPFTGSATARYLIGVQSVTEVATSLTPAVVRGLTGTGAATATANALTPESPAGVPLALSRPQQRWAKHREAELRFRELERRFLATRRPAAARPFGARAAAAIVQASAVGDTVDLKYPRAPNFCRDFVPLRAVVRVIGTRATWVEDIGNPAGGLSTAQYETLSTQFDNHIYPADAAYFGEPTDFDSNGRITILITKQINQDSVLGRVFASDFFPGDLPDGCPSSNGGEIFYGIAPDPDSIHGPAYAVQDVMLDTPVILAHELSHVIQFGRGLLTPDWSPQTIWVLEGQATLAEEIVGHSITGRASRQNYGFDVAWNSPQTSPITWYISPFIDLALYFGFESQTTTVTGAPEQCGWLGRPEGGNLGPCLGSRSLYGVSWSFLRWLTDHHGPAFPGGEQGLHQAMIQSTDNGFATMSRLTGQPIDALLAQWAASLYVDDRVPTANTLLTLPSWNLANIYGRLIEPARLRPYVRTFSSFSQEVQVRAGSTAYFLVGDGGSPAAAVSVTGVASGALPGHMRVWLVRVQ